MLHVVPELAPYGLENIVAYLACDIDSGRFEPAVVSLYGATGDGLEDRLADAGVQVFHLDKKRGFDRRMFSRFARVLRQFRPHVVHTHNYALRYTYAPALWHRIPVQVHTVHNVAQKEVDGVGRALQQIAFRRGVAPVAIAQEVAATIRNVYGVPERALIPNGICVRGYRSGRLRGAEWRRREGFGPDEILCLCVGRLAPQKDHATLLQAFAAGPAKDPRARLLLAGEGPLRTDIERQIQALGVGQSVRLLGRRQDIPDMLAAADLFVIASRWEGNPLAVMEAMSAGVPVVATAVGGVPELVSEGETGLLVVPGEPAMLASAICRLLDDATRRAAMGRAAMRKAERDFDVGVMARAYEQLYERLLCEAGAAPSWVPAQVNS
ncbi:MAG: glycosyltransferase [Acidobacteriota bacterium]|nr:glycosyltransferase [Acidobacteriota bacterium]